MKTPCQINLFLKFPGCQLHSELFHFVCMSEPLVWRLLKSFLIVTGWGEVLDTQNKAKCLPCGDSAPSDMAALNSGCCHYPAGEVKGFGAFLCSCAGGTVPKEGGRNFQQGLECHPANSSRGGPWETPGRYQLPVWLKPASELVLQLAE